MTGRDAESRATSPVRLHAKLKTLLLTNVFPPKAGGSGRWFWEIYRRLPVDSVVVAAGEDRQQAKFDRGHDLRVVRLPLDFPTWGVCSVAGLRHYSRAFRAIRRIAQSESIDNIHCGTLLPEGLIGWICRKRFGLPYLCYVHGEELNIGEKSRELGWLMRRVLSVAKLVVANSENTRRILQTNWNLSPDRVELLHPGVDTRRFVPAALDSAIRAMLGWAGRSVVLTVGRLQRRKGHDHLIRAMDQIRKAVPNALYSIAGDGEQRGELERLVQQYDLQSCVEFRGEVAEAELLHCYQQCDLFVLPNREIEGDTEGFGMVLVEAQSCGKAVIAGQSGGTVETMRPGVTGVTVDCASPEKLARVVIDLLRDADRRSQMGQEARTWVVHEFDWDSLAVRAQSLFAQVGPSRRHNTPLPLNRSVNCCHETHTG